MPLVLTRKINEAVKVGDHLIAVTRVGRGNVNLMTAKPRVVHSCAIGDIVILEPGVTVTLAAITGTIARLVFEAPREINIARLELLDAYPS